ncbi:hypothetical protein BJY04DRAFT_229519 [Aspergillus karnatakaensis]|uniref:uncharacterized protein n=1 Tax=Aspergillus karnatakaensis TaxID=1810916 RepID=UPI003CCD956A
MESPHPLFKRDELPIGTCAPGIPCSNGACCSSTGICGFSPDECGADTCISDCEAKAECGQYAPAESATCPLNVCCSKHGFCGTTEDFCGSGCQTGFGGCGSVAEPSCGGYTITKTIGYYEGCCDKRLPSDIDVGPLTHINFAFAFFHPTTFKLMPMNPGDEALYPQFTGLKAKKAFDRSLRTWIAVGGWSFNDATNSPNTQTAFSDMASSAANRRVFIDSLMNFMQTWGFDGYPGADDRGGVPADTENYVQLLKEMNEAFQGQYGVSVTLPASYWYLRWFDLRGMQENCDFLNIMTYDIHGLELLWRNELDPSRVHFGLGWYGRSFTLADPSCSTPGCIFSHGGRPGPCTKSSGTLSNAEIQRVITENNLTPTMDTEAAVKWATWDSDQWVSYDDGETVQMKIAAANKLCLGGVLIWAVDLDGTTHSSSKDLQGIGSSNGISPEDAETLQEIAARETKAAAISNSCYWSFCGQNCVQGYSEMTLAKGQVPGLLFDSGCSGNDVRSLCCVSGTATGKCSWEGWRGVGLPCSSNYCPDGSELIAANSKLNIHADSGAGGSQSFCCSGFVPSPKSNTDELALLGRDLLVEEGTQALSQRATGFTMSPYCVVAMAVMDEDWFEMPGKFLSQAFTAIVVGIQCTRRNGKGKGKGKGFSGSVPTGKGSKGGKGGQTLNLGNPLKIPTIEELSAKIDEGIRIFYDSELDKITCGTTYTCPYGQGFDEICDNQRWAIDGMSGTNVYNRDPGGRGVKDRGNTHKEIWSFGPDAQRMNEYYLRAQFPPHGDHWDRWLNRVWKPCSILRGDPPPVTFTWGEFQEGDNRIVAMSRLLDPESPASDRIRFLEAYGFNSQTDGVGCHATYYYVSNDGSGPKGYTTTLTDHGFRALNDDPMVMGVGNWQYKSPNKDKWGSPPSADYDNLPANWDQSKFYKRDIAISVLKKELPFSAIYEAEKAVELIEPWVKPDPSPTDAASFSSLDEEDDMHRGDSLPPSRGSLPHQTAPPDSRMMHRRRHLEAHRHAQGHH